MLCPADFLTVKSSLCGNPGCPQTPYQILLQPLQPFRREHVTNIHTHNYNISVIVLNNKYF